VTGAIPENSWTSRAVWKRSRSAPKAANNRGAKTFPAPGKLSKTTRSGCCWKTRSISWSYFSTASRIGRIWVTNACTIITFAITTGPSNVSGCAFWIWSFETSNATLHFSGHFTFGDRSGCERPNISIRRQSGLSKESQTGGLSAMAMPSAKDSKTLWLRILG